MAINYPNKPWTDGQVFSFLTPGSDAVTGTYNANKNAWTFARQVDSDIVRPAIFAKPTVHPDYIAPDNALIPGDIWYDTADNQSRHIYDGDNWLDYPEPENQASFQTTATLPLANQPDDIAEDPDLRSRLAAKLVEKGTLMQSDLNEETLFTLFNQRRKQVRTNTRANFINKTRVSDEWEYDAAGQNASLPEQGKFHLFQIDGQPTSHWKDVSEVVINGTGRNTNTLNSVRKGSTLEIQDVILNTFAQYIVTNVEIIGRLKVVNSG